MKTAFTAEQTAQISTLIEGLLAETAATPRQFPEKKTPIINRARELGFSYTQGREIFDLVIEAFRARAAQIAAEKRAYARAIDQAIDAVAGAWTAEQADAMDTMIHVALRAQKLEATSDEVAMVRGRGCCQRAREAYRRAGYRECVNAGGVRMLYIRDAQQLPTGKGVARLEQVWSKDSSLYKGAYKGWTAHILTNSLIVRDDYMQRVAAVGLDLVGGEMVLDVVPASEWSEQGVQVFRARYLRQSRGNEIATITGYIAIVAGHAASHDTDPDCAVRAAKRAARAAAA